MKSGKRIFMLPAVFFLLLGRTASADDAIPRLITYGDSITNGAEGNAPDADTGYFKWRDNLQDLIGKDAYNWVGRFTSPSSNSDGYQVNTSAYYGHFTAQQESFVAGDMTNYFSDQNPAGSLALIHLGTNDVLWEGTQYSNATKEESAENIIKMVRAIDARDPNVAVYVALVVPIDERTPDSNPNARDTRITAFNEELETQLLARQNGTDGTPGKSNLYIVDVNAAFKTADGTVNTAYYNIGDGIHPNAAGDTVIAQTFGNALKSNAPAPEPVSSALFLIGGGLMAARRLRHKKGLK